MSPTTRVAPICSGLANDTLRQVRRRAARYAPQMRVAVAADHAGFPLKEPIIGWVRALGHEAVDFGTDSTEPIDYPDVIAPAARAVAVGECDRAIVLGGSGTGEAIVANKIDGIRCVEAADPVTARLGRQHNDANALSMGAGSSARRSRERASRPSSPPTSRAGGTPDASRKSGISSVPDEPQGYWRGLVPLG